MIRTENLMDGRIRTYSDTGKYVLQIETGSQYEDAVDYIPCLYTYEETDISISDPEPVDTEIQELAE